jgi:hypothetical protein
MFSRRSIHSQRASSSTCVRPLSRTDRVRGLTVQLGDRLEVEAIEAFGGREPRGLDTPRDHPPLAVAPEARIGYLAADAAGQLQLNEAREELDMIQPLGGTPRADARRFDVLAADAAGGGRASRIPVRQGGQLQRLEMIREQDLRGVGHAASSDIRAM